MISYELAKKLKDAGFPDSEHWYEQGGRMLDGREGMPLNILEDLIEAIQNLEPSTNHGWDIHFSIFAKEKDIPPTAEIYNWTKSYGRSLLHQTKGSSLLEATAKLWLALKQ